MRQNVDADHIREAKGSSTWPTDRLACQGVYLFYRESLLHHELHGCKERENSDAIRNEVWGVVREDHRLAESLVGKRGQVPQQLPASESGVGMISSNRI